MANRSTSSNASTSSSPPQGQRLTPELVQAVADRVYAMLQRELALERERAPRRGRRFFRKP